jgi:hypothetical protein
MSDNRKRSIGKWILYLLLFALAAGSTVVGFALLVFYALYIGWVFAPSVHIIGSASVLYLAVIGGLFILARRRRSAPLKAVVYGGASAALLLVVSVLLTPAAESEQKPNQREPLRSPDGRYVLTVPIERSKREHGSLGFGIPYWHVTISDPNGQVLFRDAEECFDGIHNIYWVWGEGNRVWLYNSDDGVVYVYQQADGKWSRQKWGHGKTGHMEQDIAPPQSLYPDYVHSGPVQNLGTPWTIFGGSRGMGPDGETAVWFRNTETGECVFLREGESKNGITVISADWETKKAVVEIDSKRLTLSMTAHPLNQEPHDFDQQFTDGEKER